MNVFSRLVRAVLRFTLMAIGLVTITGCAVSPSLVYVQNNDIWKMDTGGGQKTKLLANGSFPQWIPKTKDTIAFVRAQPSCNFLGGCRAIFTMDHQGKNVTQLTKYDTGDIFSWSPDRQWIAFQSHRDGNWEIYKMKADGTQQIRLTNNNARDERPIWSPKGDKIAFISSRRNNDFDIFVMDMNTQAQTNLTGSYLGGDGLDASPAWSPDGKLIAFWGKRNFKEDIFVVALSSGQISNITNDPKKDVMPVWDLDGKYVLYFERVSPPTTNPLRLWRYEWQTKTAKLLSTFTGNVVPQSAQVVAVSPADVYYAVSFPQAVPLGKTVVYKTQYHAGGDTQLGEGKQPDY